MADRKTALVTGFLFCVFVLLLVIFLYYPDPTLERHDRSGDDPIPLITVKSWNNYEYTVAPETESSIVKAAKMLEDMGASFLALLAVICVAFGLACLVCACCCVA